MPSTPTPPETALCEDIVAFSCGADWRAYLREHHATSPGVWLRIYKKAARVASVDYAGALDEALCYGWIDSTKRSFDELSFLQRFSSRRSRSVWSKINREHVARLEGEGRMEPAGRMAVEQARADGRWDEAYDSSRTIEVPPDFLARLDCHPAARATFDTLSRAERFALLYRLQTAKKAETRDRRMAQFVERLARGERPS